MQIDLVPRAFGVALNPEPKIYILTASMPRFRRAVLMLRRLESQCTGGSDGAMESEEVKVKGGKREGG